MNELEIKGECMICDHSYLCRFEKQKQEIEEKLIKLKEENEISPFNIILKCPYYKTSQ